MTEYQLTTEKQLAQGYSMSIEEFWQQKMQLGELQGLDDIPISYAYVIHPNPIGSLVISSGRIECLLKYKELVFDLYQNGYSVFIHDHRGQGLSGRILENTQLGHVHEFSDYVADFKMFIEQMVTPNSQHQPMLLCHSMGGAIGALFILQYPSVFQKAVFSAPMFGIRPALPNFFARTLLSLHFKFCSATDYFWGQKDYSASPFIDNLLTHSQVRYEWFRNIYETQTNIQLGGVTSGWLHAALNAMQEIQNQGASFSIPALVIQASCDLVVDNQAQSKTANLMANTHLSVIKGARHELLMEKDSYRIQCLTQTLDFFAN
ncbi:alpha/beta fold hydrolase [Paraglaciecola sp.]|uniref:alpha/beta fold hydrolase n=1 Tax=Paraglaciecola sp. TaxID=1920173 RepID=UPI003EF4BAD8